MPPNPSSTDTPKTGQTSSEKPKSWRTRLLKALFLFIVIWFGGDFLYSRYVDFRIQRWEAEVPWTPDGFTPDAAEVEKGDGEIALLMVHGFSDTPQIYRKMLPAFVEQNYHCKAILLPGFGQNVATYASAQTESWLNKVREETALLKEEYDQVWIVAHSLGGAITIHHVLEHPGSVDGLILLAPAIEVSSQRSPIFTTRFWHEFNKIALPSTRITCSPYPMDAKDVAEQEREHRNVFSPMQVVDNTFELIDANRGRAADIKVPTLVFLASDDVVVDSPAIAAFHEDLGSSRKKLIRLDNSGHTIPVDLQWKEVVEESLEFLRPAKN